MGRKTRVCIHGGKTKECRRCLIKNGHFIAKTLRDKKGSYYVLVIRKEKLEYILETLSDLSIANRETKRILSTAVLVDNI